MSDKARLIVFDAETLGTCNEEIRRNIADRAANARAPKSTPKAEKMDWHRSEVKAERVQEALSDTAVDVLIAEPLCVSFIAWYGGAPEEALPAQSVNMMGPRARLRRAQHEGLSRLALHLDAVVGAETVIVGHNIEGFDLPLLLNAWNRHRIQPPEHWPRYMGRRWKGRVYDTMLRTPTKSGFVSLELACIALGVAHNFEKTWRGESVDGSMVEAMYEAGAYDEICEYCEDDVVADFKLYLAQTGGDRWGTFDRHDEAARKIAEIRASTMLPDEQRIAIYFVMESAGLIPRAA